MRTKLLRTLGLVGLLGLLVSQADASIVGRWSFNEGTGTTVADSIGDSHGVFAEGNPTWEAGPPGLGSALRVTRNGYVNCGNNVVKGPDFTVAVWMNHAAPKHCQILGQSHGNNQPEPGWFIFPRTNGYMWFVVHGPLGGWDGGHLRSELGPVAEWYTANEWVHLAWTFKDETKELTGYVNGAYGHSRIINESRSVIDCKDDLRIGTCGNRVGYESAAFDELQIYDHVLTPEEVLMLMTGEIVGIPQAAQPSPEDGAIYEQTFAQLTWLAGMHATSHNVYVGTDFAVVERATVPTVGNLDQASFTIGFPLPGDPYPDGLKFGTAYYWRVDEVNPAHPDSPWKGEVWSFTVPSQESYNPYPADGMIDVLTGQTLSWAPGFGAQTHTVYLGNDANEVANADSGGTVVGEASYIPAEPLAPGQTYYWRVDETSNAGVTKGTVWSLATIPDYPVTDESLIAHWKLDGPDAAVMADSSGHGLYAEIVTEGGSVEWINGAVDGAIRLDGLADIRTALDVNSVADMNTNTVTMTAWIRTDIPVGRGWGIIQETGRRVGLTLGGSNNLSLRWPGANYGSSTLNVAPAQWAFVAMVVEPQKTTLYLNGKDLTEVDQTPRDPVYFDRAMEIGTDGSGYGTRFIGAVDDLRFYSRALTPDEIEQVMQAGTPPLEEDTLMIDSFDGYRVWGYQDAPNVWDVWLDGWENAENGSLAGNVEEPYMQLSNPAGGTGLALPLHYDNTVATLSWITRTFSPAQDLTQDGATSLVLWIRGPQGDGINPADDIYVVLEDGVTSDMQVIATAEEVIERPEGTPIAWKKVTIALSDLTIDPTGLTSMTIGVGNRTNPQNSGLGTVFVDNIALE